MGRAGPDVAQRRPRGPGVVYGSFALALAVLVATLTLTVDPPSPPTVAEFAPQAISRIDEAPSEQSSAVGSAPGAACDDDGDCALADVDGPGRLPDAVDVPRVRACVGEPPRQIEDPQSPPCVPHWEGDNGGRTTRGVTGDEITIAVPFEDGRPPQGVSVQAEALAAFFNRRFEFYGRRIRLVATTATINGTPEQQLADAQAVDDTGAFAATPYADSAGNEVFFHDDLARRGIVNVFSPWGFQIDEAHMRAKRPYQWNFQPGLETMGPRIGEWVCNQLESRPAAYAGEDLRSRRRVFGIATVVQSERAAPDHRPLKGELARCGITNVEEVEQEYSPGENTGAVDRTVAARNAILQLEQAGVTSIITFAQAWQVGGLMSAAAQERYEPEWLISSYGWQTADFTAENVWPRDQVTRAFGVQFLNKVLRAEDRPWMWAYREVDPTLESRGAYGWDSFYTYWPLLVLSSGIQMAGPNLTAETFEAGLQRARFPNPGHGRAPYFQAHVGFDRSDHSFYDGDAAIVWWNQTARSDETDNLGAFCYVDGGLRYDLAGWPTDPMAVFDRSAPCY